MTKLTRRFYSGLLALLLAGHIQLAMADIVGETEKVLNWAEKVFPDFSPAIRLLKLLRTGGSAIIPRPEFILGSARWIWPGT